MKVILLENIKKELAQLEKLLMSKEDLEEIFNIEQKSTLCL